jgi:hypothetical protein
MLIGAISVISLLVILYAYLIFKPIIKDAVEKNTFHKKFYTEVYQLAIDKDFYVINDVVLEIDTKFIHFNHILFGDKYIYCICDSYFEGPISGKYSDQQWFLYKNNGQLLHIKNPLLLHRARLNYLTSTLRAEELFVGICVVNESCIVDNIEEIPDSLAVLNVHEFKEYIYKREKESIPPINSIQLDSLVQQIYQKNLQSKEKEKESYVS